MPKLKKKMKHFSKPKRALAGILKGAFGSVLANVLGFGLLIFINSGTRIPLDRMLLLEYLLFVAYALVAGVLISCGHTYFNKRFPINKTLSRRLTYEYLFMMGITLTCFLLIFVLPMRPLVGNIVSEQVLIIRLRQLYIFVVVLHSLVFFLQIGYILNGRLQKAEYDTQRLKKESMQEQFEALKNKVNPHFLFNSLNALSSLIYSDKDLAVRFVDELSSVYRYVLDHQDRELVKLRQELHFIGSYVFLLQTRYRASINILLAFTGEVEERYLPPLTLQLLIENAIRHNILSRDSPLSIEIRNEGGEYLYVKNSLQKKEIPETKD